MRKELHIIFNLLRIDMQTRQTQREMRDSSDEFAIFSRSNDEEKYGSSSFLVSGVKKYILQAGFTMTRLLRDDGLILSREVG